MGALALLAIRDIKDITTAPERNWLTVCEVAPASRGAGRPPRFLLGPASADNLLQIFAPLGGPAVRCYAIQGAYVAPTGIAVRDGIALHGDALMQPRHHVVAISDRLNAEALKVRNVPGPVAVIHAPAVETWGHWLTDFLPRLWVLAQAGYDIDTLRYIVPPDMPAFGWELLSLCGLRAEHCVVYDHWREVLHTDLLLVPTGLRAEDRLAECFDVATSFWADRARCAAGVAAQGGGAVFLSRGNAPSGRRLVNRDDIEALAAARGIVVVRPETLSIGEQIGLFTTAKVILGEYGSALHNSVFAGAGAAVCALRGTARHPGFLQSGIATSLRQDIGYVFGGTEGAEAQQAFWVDPALFRMALDLLDL